MDPSLPLKRLKDSIDIRRTALMERSEARRKGRRNISLICGVIALFSGTGMTAVLSPALDSTSLKVASAVLAFLSGILSLLLSTMFDDKETKRMIDGAGQLLAVKQQLEYVLLSSDLTSKQVQDSFKKMSDMCVKIFNEVDPLIPTKLLITTRPTADASGVMRVMQSAEEVRVVGVKIGKIGKIDL